MFKPLARLLGTAALLVAAAPSLADERAPELSYQLVEGQNLNAFVRDGQVAAHLLLRNGTDPRILVAFPAGNSGVGLWFAPLATPAEWRLDQAPAPTSLRDAKGRELHGVRATASIAAPRLMVKQAVLSNVRFLRDYQAVAKFPAEVAAKPQIAGDRIVWSRDRLDGAPGYRLELRVVAGKIAGAAITAGADGRIAFEIVAATGERPLTALTEAELLNEHAAADPAARNALRFLSYREKFMAGSWRFDTYFGRDTLMSLQMLMPALRGPAVEAGLGAVLARLDPRGEVAHEEGIGEFALIDNKAHGIKGDAATLDYGMVDDDYMLAPVAADYLLRHADTAAAKAFLARAVPSEAKPGTSEAAGKLLIRNLRFVLGQAQPFAAKPIATNLIAIHPGRFTGEWRDSEEGLGRGRYAYDVNAVLVPAALEAAAKLIAAGLLDPYLAPADRQALAAAKSLAATWTARAPALFRVEEPSAQARQKVSAYANTLGVPANPALASLGSRPLVYHAISLGEGAEAVPILNSDEGFALMFAHPAPADLETYVGTVMRPFPAGLMTGAGMVVANAAFAAPEVQARFTPAAYHGAVVWSWQQALFAAGLARQLERKDLPASTRTLLTEAQTTLWRAIDAGRAFRSSELWSWEVQGGRIVPVAFGAGKADVDESNAAQLWSTVYLAVQPPK